MREIRISVRDTVLDGTVVAPRETGRYPAVVFVHGAGRGSRSALIDQAEYLASVGVVALVYDKRTIGYSFANRDFDLLAEDALAAVRVLRERADVDPDRVGLWGVSEGGWVVPIAAARSCDVAFAILVSAPNVSPQSQAAWAFDDNLRRMGAPAGLRRAMFLALSMGEFNYSRHDPVPALENLRQPVLALYGTHDRAIPVLQSARVLEQALPQGAPPPRSASSMAPTMICAWARVRARLSRDDGELGARSTGGRESPPDVRIAGPAPEQERRAVEPPDAPTYATAPVLVAAFALAAAGYLAGPIAARLARRRGKGRAIDSVLPERWPPIRRLLRWNAAAGASSTLLMNLLIGLVVASVFWKRGRGRWLTVAGSSSA